jgi:hypothetical protein
MLYMIQYLLIGSVCCIGYSYAKVVFNNEQYNFPPSPISILPYCNNVGFDNVTVSFTYDSLMLIFSMTHSPLVAFVPSHSHICFVSMFYTNF